MNDRECPSCGRTVTVINFNEGSGTCVFCDVNGDNEDLQ